MNNFITAVSLIITVFAFVGFLGCGIKGNFEGVLVSIAFLVIGGAGFYIFGIQEENKERDRKIEECIASGGMPDVDNGKVYCFHLNEIPLNTER